MRAGPSIKTGLLGLCAIFLLACDDLSGGSGFRGQYVSARQALEDGKYEKASRLYQRLLPQAGPHEPRIRLEYAHSLLRGGEYAQAAGQARILARTQQGDARGAALAVLGTAEHELALAAINRGEPKDTSRAHLIAARDAITEVLKKHKDLDPLGALATRQRSIKAML